MTEEMRSGLINGYKRMYVTASKDDIACIAKQIGVQPEIYSGYLQGRAMEFNRGDTAREIDGLEGFCSPEMLNVLNSASRTVASALTQRPELYKAVNSHVEIR